VAELVYSEIDTERLIQPQAAIERVGTAVAAFVGRTLKGPVNKPTTIASFDEYQRIFGGLWQPSTLSYAVEQFFENGGRGCIIVRVVNGARAPTLSLRCGSEALHLIGVSPGSREFLRAAVDYDGIGIADLDCFNLVIQRLRAAGTELIEEQEILRRVSIRADAERSLPEVLAQSQLARVLGAMPTRRPEQTITHDTPGAVGYVVSNADGDDGDTLTNYDVIGDAVSGSGVFALREGEPFNFLCLPPLSRTLDIGLPTLLVALRLCRERQAILLVDPPTAWDTPAAAVEAVRRWPFHSEDALMFYPRLLAFDRLRGRYEQFGSAAASAGLLARADQVNPVWSVSASEEPMLRPGLRPSASVTAVDRIRLDQGGVNVLSATRQGGHGRDSVRTLLPESAGKSDSRSLAARRFALFVMASIERGTRWVRFEHSAPLLWAQVRAQVMAFFEGLERDGAFVGSHAAENYFVVCDERVNDAADVARGRFQLLFGFATHRAGDFQTYLVTHQPEGSSARAASVNRYALPRQS
jgi:phage tail sheath protein FI